MVPGVRNDLWVIVLYFILTNNFRLVNTFYKKREENIVTFKSVRIIAIWTILWLREKIVISAKIVWFILMECLTIQHLMARRLGGNITLELSSKT